MFEDDSNTHCNDPQIKWIFRFGWMCSAKKTRPTSPQLPGFSYDDDHNDYDHVGYEIVFLKRIFFKLWSEKTFTRSGPLAETLVF